MLTTARSLVASNRDAAQLVEAAQKFSIRLPLIGKVSVPPPDQLAFYGALGLLTALELIDWPVALAIGVGQAVMARHLREQQPGGGEPRAARVATALPGRKSAPAKARKVAAKKAQPRKAAAKKAQPRKAAARKAQPRKATKATKKT